MARQYFNSQIADSSIVAASITPTTTKTFLFTTAQANQFFPVGFGLAAPFAGQLYEFWTGGLITTPATGTLTIDPTYGPGTAQSPATGGVSLGISAAQTVTASLASQPWMLYGQLIFRTISGAASASTAWLTASFESQGTLATAGGGWRIIMGSTAAVSVDTSGTAATGLFGALNLAVTFSVTGATISSQWTSMRTLN